MQQNLRTQIYLPKDLRRQIDQERAKTGDSLAEYLRRAAEEKIEKDKKEKIDLKKLADEIVGAAKGTRTKEEVDQWIREIREERELHDKRLMERWEEARRRKKDVSS